MTDICLCQCAHISALFWPAKVIHIPTKIKQQYTCMNNNMKLQEDEQHIHVHLIYHTCILANSTCKPHVLKYTTNHASRLVFRNDLAELAATLISRHFSCVSLLIDDIQHCCEYSGSCALLVKQKNLSEHCKREVYLLGSTTSQTPRNTCCRIFAPR